ncbi:sulfatase-like hydrolase/transferase [Oceanobacter mangrovi]|uniref:sulfatase-like hydrolase/transferase n=1 Tax=Oceanobacter mangrovi TaxID=2862510 RepID=UPI001C8E8587|nr:sulfatase-like hydrolase/transferase [Oceanobacter mangrovi]
MSSPRQPNILLIMTDEERFPPHYEGQEVADYRAKHMPGRQKIRQASVSFQRHYAASTACEPSRASLFTGHYPSLHGVSQTSGMAKSSSDPGLFWLPPNTVPTIGNWLKAAGQYRTYYHGKWHISDQDLTIPGSHTGLLTTDSQGNNFPQREALYRNADRLQDYGFHGWIGPEPHGSLAANSGTIRDPGFAQQTIEMLKELEAEARVNADYQPWMAVCSFVNPHDIVFSGQSWKMIGLQQPDLSGIPVINPPTRHENLATKPRCQKDYVLDYGLMFYRQPTMDSYYQLYLYLQSKVDALIDSVYTTLSECPSLFSDTIVIFTSDHGDVLGAHGGMHQKWYNAYDECLRVPLYISTPQQRASGTARTEDGPTSHVDLLPTILQLAGVDTAVTAHTLAEDHTEVHLPVGRSLVPQLNGDSTADKPIYFMTDDEVDEGLNEISAPKITEMFFTEAAAGDNKSWQSALTSGLAQRATQQPYRPVIEPHHIETVIARIDGTLYKLSRYFENPRFVGNAVGNPDQTAAQYYVPDEWEMYDLDRDPSETNNLLSGLASPEPCAQLIAQLKALLVEQRQTKRLRPTTLNINAEMPH